MLYTIHGYERNAGTSKKTGRDYDFHILHGVSHEPLRGANKVGFAAEQIMIGADDGVLRQIPQPGEVWELSFNRAGRVVEAYPVQGNCQDVGQDDR